MTEKDHRSREDRRRQEEAEAALRRVHQDSAPILDSAMQRSADFFTARGESTDPAEIWGKRVGRILAVVVGIGCLIYLYFTYVR
jgi:hypothetical protein